MSTDVRVQVPSLAPRFSLRNQHHKCARVVELADSLDSGSSAQYGRAGSSPASRTKRDAPHGASLFCFPAAFRCTHDTPSTMSEKTSQPLPGLGGLTCCTHPALTHQFPAVGAAVSGTSAGASSPAIAVSRAWVPGMSPVAT